MTEYYTLGTWDSQGVPTYLSAVDNIPPNLINRIIDTLPEKNNVPVNNPSYLSNKPRDFLIQSTDPNFNGVDVYMTFLYEGAGYRNVVGYYVYDLNENYTIPTKYSPTLGWIPMTFEDRNAVDNNGKSILKKTVVFPNASLPTWANSNGLNSQAGGGNLLPGSKVQIYYDPTNKNIKFPNNVGIGFFVIPNGWNGSTFYNSSSRIHSTDVFNTNSNVQTILLNDLEGSDQSSSSFIVAFEDIMRPNGDADYNDVIIKITYSPQNVNTTLVNANLLSPSEQVTENSLVADKLGLYFRLRDDTLGVLNTKNITIVHTIYISNNFEHRNTLYNIFGIFNLANNGTVEKNDESEYIRLTFTCVKGSMQNYIYFFYSFSNKSQTSPINPNVSALAEFQNIYIRNDGGSITKTTTIIRDTNTNSNLLTQDPTTIVLQNFTDPYAMGDPHILSVNGSKFDIHGQPGSIYDLYVDSELSIMARTGKYFRNDGIDVLQDLVFIEYLFIAIKGKMLALNMFHMDTVYYVHNPNYPESFIKIDETTNNNINNFFEYFGIKLIEESDMLNLPNIKDKIIKKREYYTNCLESSQFIMRYLHLTTYNLGNIYIELLYMPHRNDFVNSVGIYADNLLMCNARGIWLD